MCGPITDHTYYRGVRFDVMAAQEGGTHTLMAADIPLSAVVDTALLPYLAYRELTDPPRRSLQSMTEQQDKADPPKPASPPQNTTPSSHEHVIPDHPNG
jgi:hypothetical protein